MRGVQGTLYAKGYGECGYAVIRGRVEDLKDGRFRDDKDCCSKNVEALWTKGSWDCVSCCGGETREVGFGSFPSDIRYEFQ